MIDGVSYCHVIDIEEYHEVLLTLLNEILQLLLESANKSIVIFKTRTDSLPERHPHRLKTTAPRLSAIRIDQL